MTTPATTISVQDVRNEFYTGGGPANLATLGNQLLSHPIGNALGLNAFRSRTRNYVQVTSARSSTWDGCVPGVFGAIAPTTFAGYAIRLAAWHNGNGVLCFDLINTSPAGLIKGMVCVARSAAITLYYPVVETRGFNNGYFNPVNRFQSTTPVPKPGGDPPQNLDWHIVT